MRREPGQRSRQEYLVNGARSQAGPGWVGSRAGVDGQTLRPSACKVDGDLDKGEDRRLEVREMCPWLKWKRMAWNKRPASEGVEGRNQVGWRRGQGQGPLWAEARSSLRGASPGQVKIEWV